MLSLYEEQEEAIEEYARDLHFLLCGCDWDGHWVLMARDLWELCERYEG